MLNDKIEAGRQISKQLVPSEDAIDGSIVQSEDAIDGSIVQNAKLIISLIEARKKMGVAAEVGHEAILSATAGMAALTHARHHTVACHKQLASVRHELGFSPRAMGCTLGKLPSAEAPGDHLKIVQSEVA